MQLPALSLHQPQQAVEGNHLVATTVSAVLPARNEEENIRAAVESLAAQVPTSELLCKTIYDLLKENFRLARVERVRLEETSLNSFAYPANGHS